MHTFAIIAFWTIFTGLVGASIHFIREIPARKKLAAQFPYRNFDPEGLAGELKYCDDYHAGTFYW